MGIDEESVGRPERRAWLVGGSLLLASVVVGTAVPVAGSALPQVGSFLASLSLVVFAVGIRGAGRAAGRSRVGAIALCALAGWTFCTAAFAQAFSTIVVTAPPSLISLGDLVGVVLAAVSVVAIGRSAAVPRPWNWAPAAALAAWVGLWVIEQMLRVAIVSSPPVGAVVTTLDSLVHIGAPVFLGAVAIALANGHSAIPRGPTNAGDEQALRDILDSVIESSASASALITRLDTGQRPSADAAREGQRLRFALATAEAELAALTVPQEREPELVEVKRIVAFYQLMIKHSMDAGFSAVVSGPARLTQDGALAPELHDRLRAIRATLDASVAEAAS